MEHFESYQGELERAEQARENDEILMKNDEDEPKVEVYGLSGLEEVQAINSIK